MSKIGNYRVGLQETDAYSAGYEAFEAGRHLIVQPEYEQQREAWTLGWNDAWLAAIEREPADTPTKEPLT